MTENDLRLLGTIFRLAREMATDVENQHAELCYDEACVCPYCGGIGDASPLLDALDQFKFRASFQVPE